MKINKNNFKTVIAFALLLAVCTVAIMLDLNDGSGDVYPTSDTKIMLYGESHGAKAYYDAELELWQGYYNDGCRDLFVELPYYSAELLNIWMKESSNDLLDIWFEEIDGTLSGNEYYYDFLQYIKETCPETVFHGTDVGHQFDTTGVRYLKYLEDNGLENFENYALAEECIRQGEEYYESDERHNGVSDAREAYMVSNFKAAYERQGGGKIMGIYGSYHTDLSNSDLMAGRLKAELSDVISSVKISSVILSSGNPYKLGFSVTGMIFLVMLLAPNIIWAFGNKPKDCDKVQKNENKLLLAFERVGEAASVVSLLIFPSIDPLVIRLPDGVYFRWNILIWLAALVLTVLYECYWVRYFRSLRTLKDMYSSFAGFPVAGATLPVMAIFFLGVYSQNSAVIISAVFLGIGHIGIHIGHARENIFRIT